MQQPDPRKTSMGIKSDDEILASLAEVKAERATDDIEEVSGVGEALEHEPGSEPTEDSEDEDNEDSDGTEEEAEESGEEAEESDSDESEDEDDSEDSDEESQSDEADKEIARIQEAEKDAKQRIGEKLEELKAEKVATDERLAKAEELEAKQAKLTKRIRQAPIALAKSLGLETHQDFLDLGAKLYKYGKSKAPDAKPELQAWAQGVERDGEQDSSVDELRAEVKALTEARETEKKQKEEDAETSKQEAETAAELNTFADSVVKGCSGEYPMAAKVIGELDAAEARTSIIDLARHLFQQNKKPPTTKQIFEAVEEHERSKLKRLGLDPDELFPRTKNKDKSGKASEKKKAPMKKKTNKKPQAKTDEEILASLKKRREDRLNA